MIKQDNMHLLTREQLKNKGAHEFKEGDVVICGKYRIWIKYGEFKRPSMLTTVSTRNDIRDLSIRKQPQYIRNFIEMYP